MNRLAQCAALLAWLLPSATIGLVNYDEGRLIIDGIQLLQDADDDKAYFYLPQFPRLATQADGETLEFLCVKYVGSGDAASGGLFHALIEFTLPESLETELAANLERQVPGAVLRGPVPLMEAVEDGAQGMGGFRVVSATLSNTGDGGLTREVITSGRAPLSPGSKAVVAAMLTPQGATLLWETLKTPTSDVSVAITAYYEAKVKAYDARITAEMETIYRHFSERSNEQLRYTKEEIRTLSDELIRSGDLSIEVLDRSAGLDLDASALSGILDVVTTKLTAMLFDSEAGWAKAPDREEAFEGNPLRGHQQAGFLAQAIGVGADTPYHTDFQHVLKAREDIQRNTFTVNLRQSTTIRVPIDSAGNLGGLFAEFENDPRYFRIVNLEDPVFEKRTVHFQIDGDIIDSFQDTVNFVSVNFRKNYPGDLPAVTRSLVFTHEDVKNGRTIQEVAYPRLGLGDGDWRDYEYQVRWSVRDRPTLAIPLDEEEWIRSEDPAIALIPPFERRTIEIDADRALFEERGIRAAVVEFATPLAGRPKLQRKATLRPTDGEPTRTISIYHDRNKPVGWRVTWHTSSGRSQTEARGLDSEYLYLVPPEPADEPNE